MSHVPIFLYIKSYISQIISLRYNSHLKLIFLKSLSTFWSHRYIYIHDITKILALPHDAAETEPMPFSEFKSPRCRWVGKIFQMLAQAIGPCLGLLENTESLCKLIWQTSGPNFLVLQFQLKHLNLHHPYKLDHH